MSYGTPYLQTLGFSDSLTAFVWLAGPLSGAIVQPLCGIVSDSCKHQLGRRKPFIISGACCVIASLLGLAAIPSVLRLPAARQELMKQDPGRIMLAKSLAAILVYALYISMQPLQCSVQALVIDNCNAYHQARASAWISRFRGLGSVLVLLLGNTNISKWAGMLGSNDFQALTVFASVLLAALVIMVCCFVKDEPCREDGEPANSRGSITTMERIWHLGRLARNLPPVTASVCTVQLFAYVGWFIFNFYATA